MKIKPIELLTFVLCFWCISCNKYNDQLPDCRSVLIDGPFGYQYLAIDVCLSLRDDLSYRLDYDLTENLVFHKHFYNKDCSGNGEVAFAAFEDGVEFVDINIKSNNLCPSIAYNMHKIITNLTRNTVIIQKDYVIEVGLLGPFCSQFMDIYYQYTSCSDDTLTWNWYYDDKCSNKIKPDTLVQLFSDYDGMPGITANAKYFETFSNDQYDQYIEAVKGDNFKFEYIATDIVCYKPRRKNKKKGGKKHREGGLNV